jgi:cytochrome c biogenesis protein CcmG/thiol:disulfide interchange protein DsbE
VTSNQKNAVVMFAVALVVAIMLYTGAYQSKKARIEAQNGLQGNVVGQMAPNFELETLDGKKVKLSDLRGKAVVLNFWATWCQPCKIEMPWFVEFQKKYEAEGVSFVGVAMEDTPKKDIEKFVSDMRVNYLILLGTETVGEQYGGIMGLPTTFYIGRDGKIVEQHAGLISKDEIEGHVKKAANTGPGKP